MQGQEPAHGATPSKSGRGDELSSPRAQGGPRPTRAWGPRPLPALTLTGSGRAHDRQAAAPRPRPPRRARPPPVETQKTVETWPSWGSGARSHLFCPNEVSRRLPNVPSESGSPNLCKCLVSPQDREARSALKPHPSWSNSSELTTDGKEREDVPRARSLPTPWAQVRTQGP